jgi:hypothetical protein
MSLLLWSKEKKFTKMDLDITKRKHSVFVKETLLDKVGENKKKVSKQKKNPLKSK